MTTKRNFRVNIELRSYQEQNAEDHVCAVSVLYRAAFGDFGGQLLWEVLADIERVPQVRFHVLFVLFLVELGLAPEAHLG